jgi:hypothetical protein
MSKMCAIVFTLHTWPKLVVALKWVRWRSKLHKTLNHKPFQLGNAPQVYKNASKHERCSFGYKKMNCWWWGLEQHEMQKSPKHLKNQGDCLFYLDIFIHEEIVKSSYISLLLCHALHEEELPLSLAAFLSSKITSIPSLNISPDPCHLQNLLQTLTKQEYVPHKSNHVLLLLLSLNSLGWKLQVIMHLQVGNSSLAFLFRAL